MNMNNMIKICLLLIILSVKIVQSLIPVDRYAQSSILVDKKIYFFGGASYNSPKFSPALDQVLYLDVSKSFDTTDPPFKEIPNVSIPFGSVYATALLGPEKERIYLFGGVMLDVHTNRDKFKSSLYTFNLETNEWDIPKTYGIEPEKRREMNGVINDQTRKIYIFGGGADRFVGNQNIKIFNDMNIFDTISLTWSKGSTINAPFPRTDYTATLLSNGIIVFIGGREEYISKKARDVDINEISLYNTKVDMWMLMTTRGATLENRSKHSAILTPDERIIIFGGDRDSVEPISQPLAVLDTKTIPYKWSIPQVSGTTPPPLILHSATLVGDYMFVNFGNNSYPILNSDAKRPLFYILDVRNFTWVTHFEPERQQISTIVNILPINIPTNIATNSSTNPSKLSKLIVDSSKQNGIIPGIIGVISCIIGFLSYKYISNNDIVKIKKICYDSR